MRWYVISSGSTGYFFKSDKISGKTFDGNNELFLLCMCHFFLFIYTHQQLLLFLEKWNLAILHLRIFFQREVTVGLHFPKTHTLDLLIQTGRKRMTLHKSVPTQEVAGKRETVQLVESGEKPARTTTNISNYSIKQYLWPESLSNLSYQFLPDYLGVQQMEQFHL